MSYRSARSEALFLTDKMGYELNLSDDQYNAAYEINLDYLMSVDEQGDIFSSAWQKRNTELGYVLSAQQYKAFLQMEYFYKPLNWLSNRFVFVIHNRYPQAKYYRQAPKVFFTYRGANEQYSNSPYQGRTFGSSANQSSRTQATTTGQRNNTMQRGNNSMQKNNNGVQKSDNGNNRGKSNTGMSRRQAIQSTRQGMKR